MKKLFLHGLESSGKGTKGLFFRENFPHMDVSDYSGSLDHRLSQLSEICGSEKELIFVGSSFGGLMATCFAIRYPDRVSKLILLAPALNFPGFQPPEKLLTAPTKLFIGKHDDITPPARVLPLAKKCFADLSITEVAEDHLLHATFADLDWKTLLEEGR